MDDERIIELFFERSEQAITEVSQKYGRLMTKVAMNALGSLPDAEECVNDAYLGLWNSIPPARPNPLIAFACRIVRNIAINRYHSKSFEHRRNASTSSKTFSARKTQSKARWTSVCFPGT